VTTRLYLVRHGATVSSAEDSFNGETDIALSEAGRDQARALGRRLAGERIDAFYSSPLSRAMDTARLVASPHGKEVTAVPAIREVSHGRWEGKRRAEVASQYPEEYRRWEADPWSFAPEEGETGLAVTARALPALLEIVEAHPGETVLAVSHKATIRLLVAALVGFDPRRYRDRLEAKPAGLTALDFRETSGPRLAFFNDTSHLTETPGAGSP